MSEKKEVKITAAKGRPMLTWVGKRPLRHVTAFPAQHVETFAPVETSAAVDNPEIWKTWPAAYPHGGLLFHGDNTEVLAHLLLANGSHGGACRADIDPALLGSVAGAVGRCNCAGMKALQLSKGGPVRLSEQRYTHSGV